MCECPKKSYEIRATHTSYSFMGGPYTKSFTTVLDDVTEDYLDKWIASRERGFEGLDFKYTVYELTKVRGNK